MKRISPTGGMIIVVFAFVGCGADHAGQNMSNNGVPQVVPPSQGGGTGGKYFEILNLEGGADFFLTSLTEDFCASRVKKSTRPQCCLPIDGNTAGRLTASAHDWKLAHPDRLNGNPKEVFRQFLFETFPCTPELLAAIPDPAKFYRFPPRTFDPDEHLDDRARYSYSSHLAALQEPPLHDVTVDDGGAIYRALILPTFFPSYTIRIDRSAGRIALTYKEVTGKGGYNPGELAFARSKRLAQKEWSKLSDYVAEMWSSGGVVPASRIVLDDTGWLFEAVANGRYRVVATSSSNANEDLAHLMELLHDMIKRYNREETAALNEKETMHKRAVAESEAILGPEHSGVAHALNGLAEFYRAQARYAQAEPLYQRALAIWQNYFGPENTYVAEGLENYAKLMRETGRVKKAKEMEARAKAIRAKLAGTTSAN